jgi:hypothetical protein
LVVVELVADDRLDQPVDVDRLGGQRVAADRAQCLLEDHLVPQGDRQLLRENLGMLGEQYAGEVAGA